MFKKFLATTTMVAMLTGTFGMTAMAAEWGQEGGTSTVTGTNYVVEAAFEVELPGDLTFGINPMYLDADGDGTKETTQIVTGDYYFTNYSNVPVLITTETWASTVNTSINYLSTLEAASWNATTKELAANASADKKNVALLITLPSKVELTSEGVKLTPAEFVKGTSVINESSGGVQGYMISNVENSKTKIQYVLAKAADTTTVAQVGAFQFSGAVDPNKTYGDEDITVTTTFTLNALTASQVDESYEALTVGGSAVDTTVTAVQEVSP